MKTCEIQKIDMDLIQDRVFVSHILDYIINTEESLGTKHKFYFQKGYKKSLSDYMEIGYKYSHSNKIKILEIGVRLGWSGILISGGILIVDDYNKKEKGVFDAVNKFKCVKKSEIKNFIVFENSTSQAVFEKERIGRYEHD